jgi:hypothetical protein
MQLSRSGVRATLEATLALASVGTGMGSDFSLMRKPTPKLPKTTICTVIAIANGKPAGAVDPLTPASPSPPRIGNTWWWIAKFQSLSSVCARPRVSRRARKGRCSGCVPGIMANYLIRALAHLQSGRTFVLAGEREKARAAYQRFLHTVGKMSIRTYLCCNTPWPNPLPT